MSRFRPFFVSAAGFSLVVNVLMLAPALFMLQVFDRVLTSRSLETLIMLLALVIGALLFMAYLDMIRSRLLTAAAVTLEKRLGPRVLGEMIRRSAAGVPLFWGGAEAFSPFQKHQVLSPRLRARTPRSGCS